MEEKIIIKGAFTKKNVMTIIFGILAIVSFIISFAIYIPSADSPYHGHRTYSYYCWDFSTPEGISFFFYLSIVFLLVAIFFWIEMSFCEVVVTDKRVYGKTSFGKSIDLPYDKISSVGTCFPMGVFTATSSGVIKFWLLTNQKEVYSSISNLLKERQILNNTTNVKMEQSSADELKKFKDLLDSGIITQEEFDAKKKQLLGL